MLQSPIQLLQGFQSKWNSQICQQDASFRIQFDVTAQKLSIIKNTTYTNRQSVLDTAIPMEPLRHLLQTCLQNESQKRFVLIPIDYIHGSDSFLGILLIHHHATLKSPYVIRVNLTPDQLSHLGLDDALNSTLKSFFADFGYTYLNATRLSTPYKKISQWLQSKNGQLKPFGTETYQQLYRGTLQSYWPASAFAILTYQFSNIAATWSKCEKWFQTQNPLEMLEILTNTLALYESPSHSIESVTWADDDDDDYHQETQAQIASLMDKITYYQNQLQKSETSAIEQQERFRQVQAELTNALAIVEKHSTENKEKQQLIDKIATCQERLEATEATSAAALKKHRDLVESHRSNLNEALRGIDVIANTPEIVITPMKRKLRSMPN